MRFEEAMKAMREGKKVRRKSWDESILYIEWDENAYSKLQISRYNKYLSTGDVFPQVGIDLSSIFADDWEVVEEKPHRKIVVECTVGESPCIAEEIVGENCLFLCLSIDKKEEFHGRKIKITVETVD